jgi:hypothetical protein
MSDDSATVNVRFTPREDVSATLRGLMKLIGWLFAVELEAVLPQRGTLQGMGALCAAHRRAGAYPRRDSNPGLRVASRTNGLRSTSQGELRRTFGCDALT